MASAARSVAFAQGVGDYDETARAEEGHGAHIDDDVVAGADHPIVGRSRPLVAMSSSPAAAIVGPEDTVTTSTEPEFRPFRSARSALDAGLPSDYGT